MTTLPAQPRRHAARKGFPARTLEKTAWTILVWTLFALVVLGPLLTVVSFSFTHNVFHGAALNSVEWYAQLFSDPQLLGPLIRSFEVALIVVVVQLFFGTMIAYSTARRRIFGAGLLDAMTNITIALPSVVVGLALLAFYGPFGPVSNFVQFATGNPFTLTWTLAIVVFAHVLETFPYMVRTVSQGLLRISPDLESAARSLGGRPWYVFRTITLPQLRPALVSGGVLVLSRSIAEFGATIIVVSAILRTAPVSIYSAAESGSMELASAYSVVLMIVSFTAYVVMSRWLLRTESAQASAGEPLA